MEVPLIGADHKPASTMYAPTPRAPKMPMFCAQPMAPDGAPSVLFIVLDDVGFSAMESFGGSIETPNLKRIADSGLTYTNFHTTALCSPTAKCGHHIPTFRR
jgi:hypothetical protein